MSRGTFTAIRTEGGLLPQEILERAAAEDPDLPGTSQEHYHLPPNERLGEAINRSWNRLLGLWEAYTEALEGLRADDPAIGLTRDRWLLPVFDELGYGRLQRTSAVEIEGKTFAISHRWHRTPIHLVGAGVSIDRRAPGVAGAAAAAPHSLVQEFLNRSHDHLWAFVSNGRLLRILRDNHSLSRQAYVEFDLEAIMDGELFSDFRVLWLVCHQSRVEAEEPAENWLETWFQVSREEGVRALDALRDGVERAIEVLGAGFLRHPANTRLHEGLTERTLDRQEYYRELLRLVYRLIFLFVAEDRDALLDPGASPEARKRYMKYYASNRLRGLAGKRRGTAHDDLWRGLRLVLSKLHDGNSELGLPALGSFLWSAEATSWIGDAELRNDDLLAALRALGYTEQDHQLLPVNWRTLGSEELGSVYESLLELHPQMNREAGTFELSTAAGHERKTTGSYYTPTSLVDRLLDSALEPVLEEAMRAKDPEKALLDLKVCDTAVGSGHFLVAAARRIALRLASVRTGDEEASPEAVTHALRDVVGRSIYGVDVNPLAVELCKVSLWMEALEPGKPLSFLDHHIQLGNSLLGTTPHLLREGIPDSAFEEIEGDDKKVVLDLRKQNRDERKSEQVVFHSLMVAESGTRFGAIQDLVGDLNQGDDSTLKAVRQKEAYHRRLLDDPRYRTERLAADAWCASFVWRKTKQGPPAITEDLFREFLRQPDEVPSIVTMEVRRLADRYRFFHFHLAFPDVFHARDGGAEEDDVTGWPGGFDVVLGNPPWDHTELKEKEWFAERAPEIASAAGAKRKKLIATLEEEDPELFDAFLDAKREADGLSHIARHSGRFPLCGRGRINTYAIFAEGNRQIVAPQGRMGIIVPTGIATDATTQYFFQDLMDSDALISLYDFENREKIFPAVDSRMKFCLLTVAGAAYEHDTGAEFAFFLHSARELDDDERRFALSKDDIALLNPNTRTCPVFRTRRDWRLSLELHKTGTHLIREAEESGNPWGVETSRMFNMSDDAASFVTLEDLTAEGAHLGIDGVWRTDDTEWVRLYEAKMLWFFDHRWTENDHSAEHLVETKHNMSAARLREWTQDKWGAHWFLSWREITNATNERTVITAILPWAAVGHTAHLIMPQDDPARSAALLSANLNSTAVDYAARQKLGGTHLTHTALRQLPVLSPSTFTGNGFLGKTGSFIASCVLELTYTAHDVAPFAAALGFNGGPFRWDEERRFLLRCELDATFFHLYGIERDDVAYILETFPIVKRKDVKEHGEYRTKRVILEMYDAMEHAASTSMPYQTRLDPPPAHPSLAHDSEQAPVGRAPVPAVLTVPDSVPTLDPQQDAIYIALALVHATGGTIPIIDLARAFALWSQPKRLARAAPSHLSDRVEEWLRRADSRTVPPGTLARVLRELVDRGVFRRIVDESSRSAVSTTATTPSEERLLEWYRFEARLALNVLVGMPADAVAELESEVGESGLIQLEA